MNFGDMARLSFYEDLTDLGHGDKIRLVKHRDSGAVFVKKTLHDINPNIYYFLKNSCSEFFPKISEIVEDSDSGNTIIIEEFINGSSLDSILSTTGVLFESEAVCMMKDLARALDFLHSQRPPVIHRDLKPSNIVRSNSGKWIIVDFDIAREYNSSASRDTTYLGTREFAAPEQYGFRQTDGRTDIYSLGLLVKYTMCGNLEVETKITGKLSAIIDKCIEFEPSKRFQNAGQLIDAIDKLFLNKNLQSDYIPQKKESQDKDFTTFKKTVNSYLPPGFRSRRPINMIIAFVGYIFIVWMSVDLIVKNGSGEIVTGIESLINKIVFFTMCIAVVFFSCNYRNIQDKLFLVKRNRPIYKIIGYIVWLSIIVFGLAIFMAIIESLFFR